MTADPFANIPNADDSLNGEFSPAKISRPAPAYGITDRVSRAAALLAEAHDAGLPMPGYVTADAHDHGDWRSSSIRFQLADDDKVGAWARHFGRPFVSEKHGSSVTLESSGQHDVQAYHWDKPAEKPIPPQPPMTDTMSGSYVPGLAEHTQAAAVRTLGDHCGKCFDPNCDGSHQFVPGLDEHTQAACDTIKAASE